jgi:hypothetical protein
MRDFRSCYLKYIFILFIIIKTIHVSEGCQLDDGFEGSIDPRIWKIEGAWVLDSEDKVERSQSLKSELIGDQTSKLSNNISFMGPCNISFWWKISNGYNSLILYDNGLPTIHRLPTTSITSGSAHNSKNWTKVQYSLSDFSMHTFSFIHDNPSVRSSCNGNAWIDDFHATYSIPPRFERFSVFPSKAIFRPHEYAKFINSTSEITSKFNYSVSSSTKNLSLYILLPGRVELEPLGPYYPNFVRNSSNGLYQLDWINIELKCEDIGNGKYFFMADGNYPSIKKNGPDITTIILGEATGIYNTTDSGSNLTFNLSLKSKCDWKVALRLPEDKLSWVGKEQVYSANSGICVLNWDQWFDTSSLEKLGLYEYYFMNGI